MVWLLRAGSLALLIGPLAAMLVLLAMAVVNAASLYSV
jgi:hypothetical protein